MTATTRAPIALIALNAPPRNTPESLQVGKYSQVLAERLAVTLVTAKRFDSWGPSDEANSRERAGYAGVLESAVPERRVLGALERRLPFKVLAPDDEAAWLVRAPLIARQLKRLGVTRIYSRATPHTSSLMGLAMARRLRVPWVMHLSDPWTINPFRVSARATDALNARMEVACFEAATKITVTSESTRAAYAARYPRHRHKLLLFPNVYGVGDVGTTRRRDGEPWTVVHTGRLYGRRSPRPFLAAVERFLVERPAARTGSRFVFAGFADVDASAALRGVPAPVEFLGPVDYDRARALQAASHLLVAIDAADADERYDLFFPSKLLDYMAARRKVLALTRPGSETARFVAHGTGDAFRHEDTDAIVGFLVRAWDAHCADPEAAAAPGPLLAEYSAAHQGARLTELLLSL